MKTTDISKVAELNEYAQLLLDNGFTVIAAGKTSSWFHFSKDNKIGYVQYQRIGGATFSTVHKPCKECGTGYRVSEDYADLNIINAESALCFAPHWAKRIDTKAIVKYKDVADFMNRQFNKENTIITPKN